jgi:SAM-dependent methyltransferase
VDDSSRLPRGDALFEHLLALPLADRDAWVDELLGIDDTPSDVNLPRGSVPYLPCGVDEVLAMVRDVPVRSSDDFVDLGSGIGRVAILVHLLSNAHASGIEIQEALVRNARIRCAQLGLNEIQFVHANVADMDLDGSIFFLYAPFNGEMLASVLRRIETVAQRKAIVVCTVGLELHAPWLIPRSASSVTLSIYDATPR